MDAGGKIVMPGFVNTHTHSYYGIMARGILTEITLFLEQGLAGYMTAMSAEKSTINTSMHVLEGIKRGTTTFCDNGTYTNHVAKVYEQCGVRARLSESIREMSWDYRDQLGEVYTFDRKYAGDSFAVMHELLDKYGTDPNDRISAMVSFQALDFVSEETVIEIRELAKKRNAMIHTHLAQSRFEIEQVEKRYGVRPVEAFERLGLLNGNTLAAHLVYNLPEENKKAAESGLKMAYCPYTFGRKGLTPPAAQFVHYGGTVGIGSDEACYTCVNPISDMKSAHVSANVDAVLHDLPKVPLYRLLRMHTVEAAQAIGLGAQTGSLEPGKKADVILLGLHAVNMQPVLISPLTNIPQNIIVAATGTEVETVLVDGKTIMENGVVKTMDENKIIGDLQKLGQEAMETARAYYEKLPSSEVLDIQNKLKQIKDEGR
ncbi:MAG: amidohydrolase family protein [Clostridiales Family XIII bacterium]|nr:amidohydrolase family protein [Clostridiales Family XIII bacterium]